MNGLRQHSENYLAIRRALGYKLKGEGQLLAGFVAFVEEAGAPVLTTDLAVTWTRKATSGTPAYLARRMRVVRSFARYLHTLDPATEIPPLDLFSCWKYRPTPYLYSDAEVAALMAAARQLAPPLRAATFETLIGLLAATGLRISEAMRLDRDDLDKVNGLLTVRESILVLASGQGTLAAPGSWEPVTATMTVGRSYHAAAVGSDGRVYAIGGVTNPPGASNTVEAYDPAKPNDGWKVVAPMPTPRGSLAATTGEDGRIYAIGGANPQAPAPLPTVEVYDPATNRWAPVAPLSVPRSGLAAATGPDGRIYAIGGMGVGGRDVVEVYDPAKPNEGWKTAAPMPTPRRGLAAATGSDGRIYVIGGDNGLTTVEAYTPAAPGTPGSWASAPSLGTARRDLAAATGPDGRIYAIGGSSSATPSGYPTVEAYAPGSAGTPSRWEPVAPMSTARAAVAATGTKGTDGRIYAIGGNGGLDTAEAYAVGGSTSPPSTTTSTSSTTTTSTTMPPPQDNGVVREYPLPQTNPRGSRRPYGITTGPDGNLWFTEQLAQRIGRITPRGAVTEFSLPGGEVGFPTGITAGPDGNLWFTQANDVISRITISGAVTQHQLPSAMACVVAQKACSVPTGISAGPDGNLWFTEAQGNRIGQINPATGAIKEFSLPTVGSSPTGITPGPDGNLWFAESLVNDPNPVKRTGRIGRITPSGAITEFPVPTPDSQPTDITTGPDGNLWFTENGVGKVGRITPAGTITEFNVPTRNSRPHDITGPDGNLWFTENGVGKVGRMNTAGVTTEFPLLSDNSEPVGITTGPDSAIWFTEYGVDRIGRIDPGASPPPECPEAESNTRLGPWARLTPMCTARTDLAATRGGDGRIYALGGTGPDAFGLNTAESYDPGVNRWEQVAPMLTGRYQHAAATGYDGRIYAVGGLGSTTDDLSQTHGVVPQLEAYDPAAKAWAALAPMPTPRFDLAAAAGPDGRIYAIGGSTKVGLLTVFEATLEAYDPKANAWQRLAPMPTARTGLSATTGPDGRIYAVGGQGRGNNNYLDTVEAYNPATNTWETLPPMPTARHGLAAATGSDGSIYSLGGFDKAGATDAAEAYDVAAKRWSNLLPVPTYRFGLAAATGPDGRIYAIGGTDAGFNPLNMVEAYDPTGVSAPGPSTACSRAKGAPPLATTGSGVWSEVAPIPTPRVFAGSAAGPDGCVYVMGGQPAGLEDGLHTVEAYDPSPT